MKHLKTYEMLYPDDIKVGDYVLVTCEYHNLKDEPMIIDDYPKYDLIYAIPVNDKERVYELQFDDIVKKLTKKEVELYSNLKKYNL